MGITIGDALAVVGGLFAICISVWTLVMATTMLFGARAERAETAIGRPWRCFFVGLAVALTLGLLAVAMTSAPNPAAKLVGTLLYVVLLSISAVGGAGLALAASRRVRELDPEASAFSALARGAGVLVLSALVPLLGWFGIAPIALLVGLGAGVQSVFGRAAIPAAEPAGSWQ